MNGFACRLALAVATALCLASGTNAQTITTGFTGATIVTGNFNGNFFDVKDLTGAGLILTAWDVHCNVAAGTAQTVQVWFKSGTWSGFQVNAGAWTLAGEVTVNSAGVGVGTRVVVSNITVPPNGTVGIRIGVNAGSLRYYPAATTTTPIANLDVQLDFGSAQGAIFVAAVLQPRGWNGTVHYVLGGNGACCRQDGTCSVGTGLACATAPAGSFQGPATTCDPPFVCPQPGACCAPENAGCTFIAGFACAAPNTFSGPGTTCTPNTCPAGACCMQDGACTSVTAARCQSTGGTFTANGTACTPGLCPQQGACCLSNGGCVFVIPSECTLVSGTFGGSGVLCALGGCWMAPILYHNGGVVTHTAQGAGGADASQLPPGGAILGYGFGLTANRLADEFTVPPGQSWAVTKFKALGYQTGSTPTTNPFLSLAVRIWDRDPRQAGAVALWGDFTTNILDFPNSTFSNTYRVTTATGLLDVQRPLYNLVANVPSVVLGPGTYWVEWGGTNGVTPFVPPVTVTGVMPFGNAIQFAGGAYQQVVDLGVDPTNYAAGKPAGIPFVLEGSSGVGGICCLPNGSCTPAIPNGATPSCQSGTLTIGGTCTPNTCPQPQAGICCQTDGSCTLATPGIPATCATGTLVVSGTCTPNTCPQPQAGICCQTNGSCTLATPGIPNATCAAGTLVVSGTCTPNTCPQPPQGVCCRGSTCTVDPALQSQATCAATVTGTAGAVFVATGPCGGTNHLIPCCHADYNKIGGRNVTDIFAYLTDWFAARPWAIVGGNGTGTPGVPHIFAFLTDWFAGGCP